MRKKAGVVILVAGMVLILSALSLLLYNRKEARDAGQAAESLLQDVQAQIQQQEAQETESVPLEVLHPEREDAEQEAAEDEEELQDAELPVTTIEGLDYIGYISIPDLGIELPVQSSWDYERLKLSPCRQFGSSRSDDLVIAAHNYVTHFGSLGALQPGSRVTFTDMEGNANLYEVIYQETLEPTAVDAVQNSGYDLVLYTCTYHVDTRITVFCNRVDQLPQETE